VSPGFGRDGLLLRLKGGRLQAYAAIRISWRTRSAQRSPIMIVAALVLPEMTVGMIEASATRSPVTPRTLSSGSTTAIASIPILQVLVG
jgi:hypothetical protein